MPLAMCGLWFTGMTTDDTTDFPITPDALKTTPTGTYDAYVAKISVDGSALLYATFLGGSGNDYGAAITLDATGNVWLIGQTDDAGTDFPTTPDALYATPAGGSDVFVCHLQTHHYPPESLIATTSPNQPVYLLWDPPSILVDSALLTYRVYRGTTSGNYGIHIAETTQAFFVDATIPSDGTYYYAITAINDYGESDFSNEAGITVTTPISRPMSPENLSAAPGETFIELSWAIPSNAGGSPITGYRVYRGTSSGIYTLLAVTASLNYNDTSVLPGVTYYYVVTAINAVGESDFSLEVSSMLTGSPDPAITVPEAPQNLSVTPGENYVALTWVAPSNTSGATITGYRVYRGTTQGEYVLIITTNNTIFNDTTAIGGIKYYYVVSALNVMGESPFSLEVSATPSTGPPFTPATVTSPSAPQDLAATPGELMVILSWSAPSSDGNAEISYYRVYRGTKSGEYLLLAIAMDTNYNDTSVSGNTLYYYMVTAMNEAGESPFSNEVSVTPSSSSKSVGSEDSAAPGFLAASALLGILVVIFRKNKKREPD
jgi:fibronectin type 3 domain-containing protein